MPTQTLVTKTGPRTYIPAVGEVVIGGHFVEARPAGRIAHAAAGAVKWLGAAIADAIAPEDQVLTPTTVGGRQVLNTVVPAGETAVAYSGDETRVEYAGPAGFGDPLVIASDGRVMAAGATPDARTIAAKCTEPNGVSGAGVYGLTRVL